MIDRLRLPRVRSERCNGRTYIEAQSPVGEGCAQRALHGMIAASAPPNEGVWCGECGVNLTPGNVLYDAATAADMLAARAAS